MKKHLFTVPLGEQGLRTYRLRLFVVLLISLFFSSHASAVTPDSAISQNNPEAVIYVSESAVVFGIEEVTNAQIVKIKVLSKVKDFSKTAVPKIKKQIPISKTRKENQVKDLPQLSKPQFVFQKKKSEESFGAAAFSNTKNSVVNSVFVSEDIVSDIHTKPLIPLFVYLMNIYTADFSKTAALSQFLFSRPPPCC